MIDQKKVEFHIEHFGGICAKISKNVKRREDYNTRRLGKQAIIRMQNASASLRYRTQGRQSDSGEDKADEKEEPKPQTSVLHHGEGHFVQKHMPIFCRR